MSAPASAIAVKSEPPRPSVVVSPSGVLSLKTGHDHDVILREQGVDLLRADIRDLRFRVRAIGQNARFRAGQRNRFAAERVDGHGGERNGGAFAGGEQNVELARRWAGRHFTRELEQVVGYARHRGNDRHDTCSRSAASRSGAARHFGFARNIGPKCRRIFGRSGAWQGRARMKALDHGTGWFSLMLRRCQLAKAFGVNSIPCPGLERFELLVMSSLQEQISRQMERLKGRFPNRPRFP